MDDRFFSRRWVRDYFRICSELRDIDVIGNDIECDDSIGVDEGAICELIEIGYNKTEIFGLTHMFVAHKRARSQLKV
jgi:hypothetical protein